LAILLLVMCSILEVALFLQAQRVRAGEALLLAMETEERERPTFGDVTLNAGAGGRGDHRR
jgi:hypothetical protein